VLVEINTDEHAKDAKDVHLDTETQGKLYEDQIDSQWGADTRREVRGEYILNRALGSHDVKDFTKDSA
jgi:hypothetical protein